MQNKLAPILAGTVVVALVGIVVFMQVNNSYVPAPADTQNSAATQQQAETQTQATTSAQTSATATVSQSNTNNAGSPTAVPSYTLAHVSAHKDASSCWSAV